MKEMMDTSDMQLSSLGISEGSIDPDLNKERVTRLFD